VLLERGFVGQRLPGGVCLLDEAARGEHALPVEQELEGGASVDEECDPEERKPEPAGTPEPGPERVHDRLSEGRQRPAMEISGPSRPRGPCPSPRGRASRCRADRCAAGRPSWPGRPAARAGSSAPARPPPGGAAPPRRAPTPSRRRRPAPPPARSSRRCRGAAGSTPLPRADGPSPGDARVEGASGPRRGVPQLLFDAEELVVLCGALAARDRAGLDLTG